MSKQMELELVSQQRYRPFNGKAVKFSSNLRSKSGNVYFKEGKSSFMI